MAAHFECLTSFMVDNALTSKDKFPSPIESPATSAHTPMMQHDARMVLQPA
jgi:hypothetical protein